MGKPNNLKVFHNWKTIAFIIYIVTRSLVLCVCFVDRCSSFWVIIWYCTCFVTIICYWYSILTIKKIMSKFPKIIWKVFKKTTTYSLTSISPPETSQSIQHNFIYLSNVCTMITFNISIEGHISRSTVDIPIEYKLSSSIISYNNWNQLNKHRQIASHGIIKLGIDKTGSNWIICFLYSLYMYVILVLILFSRVTRSLVSCVCFVDRCSSFWVIIWYCTCFVTIICYLYSIFDVSGGGIEVKL
jgi:hypothetical protein